MKGVAKDVRAGDTQQSLDQDVCCNFYCLNALVRLAGQQGANQLRENKKILLRRKFAPHTGGLLRMHERKVNVEYYGMVAHCGK